jgi:hypothetical protein
VVWRKSAEIRGSSQAEAFSRVHPGSPEVQPGQKKSSVTVGSHVYYLDFSGSKGHSLRSLPFQGPKMFRFPGPNYLTLSLVMDLQA